MGVVPAAGRRTSPQAVRAIVLDLDGTLLRSDGTLSSASMATLCATREIGVPLIVATSRTPRAVRRIAGHELLGTVVCANGAIVWSGEHDDVLEQTSFEPAALIAALERFGTQVPDAAIALLSADTMFLDERYLAQRSKKGLAGAVLAPSFGQVVYEHAVVAVAVRHPSLVAEQLLGPVAAAFAGAGEATFAGTTAVDVVPSGATKSTTVERLLTDAGHPGGSAVVFGDMPNDLGLFAWSGWACAVANSHPLVLQAADEIVPSNDDDGVARTIRSFCECTARNATSPLPSQR
jgi:Cof subfamily protein (haloacid dehalogenase superfamily)